MLEKNKSKEKMCLFFVSDYHFEMISLPYINESLKNKKQVIVLTENNLQETAEKVLTNINLKDEEKRKLNEINWNNNSEEKIEEIKNLKDEDVVIFVKGKKSYIKNINCNLKNENLDDNLQIINCYDVSEINDNFKDIVKDYTKVLSTSGVEELL